MSHVGDVSNDFEGLEGSDIDPETLRMVKQARMEARDIIDRLEPRHITGWPSLIALLEDCLATAKRNAIILKI